MSAPYPGASWKQSSSQTAVTRVKALLVLGGAEHMSPVPAQLVKERGFPSRTAAATRSPPSVLHLGNGVLSGASDILQIMCFFCPRVGGPMKPPVLEQRKAKIGMVSLSRSPGQTALERLNSALHLWLKSTLARLSVRQCGLLSIPELQPGLK